jgi:23S rRNA pseudouridine1911/1915/1917 synthase
VTGADASGRRLDEAVAERAGVSRSVAARWIADGRVTVDGRHRPKAWRLHGAEAVRIDPPAAPPPGPPAPEERPLAVRYEDEHLLVAAKPAGLVVHPAPGHDAGTLVNALLGRAGTLSTVAGADRPGIVHRLDRDTSGLLLVAKDDAAHTALAADLAGRRIERGYQALAQGALGPPDDGVVDAPIGRHPRDRKRMAVVPGGRPARTWWHAEERLRLPRFGPVTHLGLRLDTGRTHQIRVHLAHLRHPLAGDLRYGADPRLAEALGLDRPFLHAGRLAFTHPVTGRAVELTEPLPAELEDVLARLRVGPGRPVPSG